MDDVKGWLATLTAVVVALSGMVPLVITIWKRVGAQERRLAQFWHARLVRGTAEALTKKLIVEQIGPEEYDPEGPFMTVALVKDAHAAYAPIADKLRALRVNLPEASENELAEKIEERFGPWLARFICVPLGVSEYACIVMALSVANGIEPVTRPSSHD